MILILIIINDFFLDFDCDFLSFGCGFVFVQCVVDSLVVVFEIFDVQAVLGEFEVFYDEGADLEGTQGDVLFELFVEDVVLLGKGDHLFPVPFGGQEFAVGHVSAQGGFYEGLESHCPGVVGCEQRRYVVCVEADSHEI